MSKIICDVCGTAYPETVEQCPICGCVRPADVQNVMPDPESNEPASGYTYVKGGRFSKSNVRKRVKSVSAAAYYAEEDPVENSDPSSSGRKGLTITAIVLLLAIIGVVIYITICFFNTGAGPKDYVEDPNVNTGYASTESVNACTDLSISDDTITLTEVGSAWLLNVTKTPEDTSETLSCSVDDESVATATVTSSDKIKITAVASGETVVYISCGDQEVSCKIICDFTDNTTVETEPSETSKYTVEDIIFNSRYNPPEATLRSEGEIWNCYKGNIPAEEITWISDNENVATVKDGVVTAVGKGNTKIHAVWGEYDLTCTVRCNFITTETGIPGSDDVELG